MFEISYTGKEREYSGNIFYLPLICSVQENCSSKNGLYVLQNVNHEIVRGELQNNIFRIKCGTLMGKCSSTSIILEQKQVKVVAEKNCMRERSCVKTIESIPKSCAKQSL